MGHSQDSTALALESFLLSGSYPDATEWATQLAQQFNAALHSGYRRTALAVFDQLLALRDKLPTEMHRSVWQTTRNYMALDIAAWYAAYGQWDRALEQLRLLDVVLAECDAGRVSSGLLPQPRTDTYARRLMTLAECKALGPARLRDVLLPPAAAIAEYDRLWLQLERTASARRAGLASQQERRQLTRRVANYREVLACAGMQACCLALRYCPQCVAATMASFNVRHRAAGHWLDLAPLGYRANPPVEGTVNYWLFEAYKAYLFGGYTRGEVDLLGAQIRQTASQQGQIRSEQRSFFASVDLLEGLLLTNLARRSSGRQLAVLEAG